MSWQTVRLVDMKPVPWRNGGGVTRELLAWPQAGDWRVRMSVAQVERDGPFSRFEGVRRWFAVLSGAGVRLRLDGARHALGPDSAPFAFDGGAATDCELVAGPTEDFNLMLRGCVGRMERFRGAQELHCQAGTMVASYDIAAGTLCWRILDADGAVRVEAPDALWMEIQP